MRLFNCHSIEWKLAVLLAIRLANLTLVHGQETADKVFMWDKGDKGHGFWNKAINCGRASQPGGANNTKGSKVTFGVTSERRYPGTRSVEFWTNSNYEERCNQNFSAERAEMSAGGSYRSLGIKEGSTVWVGWSEMWKEVDETHSATVMQFRSNCGSGSPATELYMRPGRMLQLRVANGKRLNLYSPNINQWYDMVIEIKYSKSNSGYVNIWYKKASDSDYQKKSLTNIPTMLSGDGCPHMRWGVYRWASGDKKPSQIPAKDRMMIKYVGPVRMKVGSNLKDRGFKAVAPRSPDGRDITVPTPTPIEEEKPTPAPPEEETYVETDEPVGECESGENLAIGQSTSQSSRYGYGDPERAVDSDLSTNRGPWTNGSITHTKKDKEAWWEVDLGASYAISQIHYTGRTDCCKDRLKNAYVMVSNNPFPSNKLEPSLSASGVWNSFQASAPNPTHRVETGEIVGRYVRIQLKGTNFLSLADVKVIGCPVVALQPGESGADTRGKFFEDSQSTPDADTTEVLKFYPNVANSHFFLETERPAVILITDFNGIKVKKMDLGAGRHRVGVSHLSEGIYLITRYYGDTRTHGKLVIQRQ